MKNSKQRKDVTFLSDGMLGSLARKLRILGFDTMYDSKSSDNDLLRIAKETKRYLLTSDVELYFRARTKKIDSILIRSSSERGRLYEVLSNIGESSLNFSRTSRCSACNGLLEDSGRADRAGTIYKCVDCGKDYWRGSHWKKLTMLFREVDSMLQRQEVLQV